LRKPGDQYQACDPIGVGQREVEREVAAERVAAEYRALDAEFVQQRDHVGDGVLVRIAGRVGRRLTRAVAAQIPGQ
jgi:hypothetical protein